jgi:hypothetical protein
MNKTQTIGIASHELRIRCPKNRVTERTGPARAARHSGNIGRPMLCLMEDRALRRRTGRWCPTVGNEINQEYYSTLLDAVYFLELCTKYIPTPS